MSDRAVLVCLPNWIGDAAMSVPALRALQAARPSARWILAAHPRNASLFGRWPSDLMIVAGRPGGEGLARFARRLRHCGCSEALILPVSFRSAVAPYLAGIPRRVAFASDSRGLLLTESVRPPGKDAHLARQFVRLAARLGANPEASLDPLIPIGEDEVARQEDRLHSLGLQSGSTIALCPGATYGETKRWPATHWMALAEILRDRGWSMVILGGAHEAGLGDLSARGERSGITNLAGQLTLRESLSILRLLRGAVSNDSGAMHLAAAAGCPVLGLFGSTNPDWTGPLGPFSRSLRLGIACSPCYSRRCPTQIECLRDLAPQRVASAFDELLEAAGRETEP